MWLWETMDRLQLYCEPGLKLSETKLSIKQPDQQLLFPCQYVFRVVKYEASVEFLNVDIDTLCNSLFFVESHFCSAVASSKNCKKAIVEAFQKFHCQNWGTLGIMETCTIDILWRKCSEEIWFYEYLLEKFIGIRTSLKFINFPLLILHLAQH